MKGHQDPANLAESLHEPELLERVHGLDRPEGIRANHLITKKKKKTKNKAHNTAVLIESSQDQVSSRYLRYFFVYIIAVLKGVATEVFSLSDDEPARNLLMRVLAVDGSENSSLRQHEEHTAAALTNERTHTRSHILKIQQPTTTNGEGS